jgi:hypothetical protein
MTNRTHTLLVDAAMMAFIALAVGGIVINILDAFF